MSAKHARIKTEYRLLIILIAASIAMACLFLTSCVRPDESDFDNSDYEVLDEIPEWTGEPYIELGGNRPEFTRNEIKGAGFEHFTELDRLGRCGPAIACVGPETMPEGERGSIGMVRPSGWQIAKYDFIDNGGYLYNRCHLVGWQLTGQNEEERNLITGTRYMNTQGMLPFENETAEYVRRTGNHVMYRSTPLFKGEELVARGVQIEAYSVEDKGKGVLFNVFCYNVQPGVRIDYMTGKSTLDSTYKGTSDNEKGEPQESGKVTAGDSEEPQEPGKSSAGNAGETEKLNVPKGVTYILNKNTMRFHRADCKGAAEIKEHNREWFYGTRDEAISLGFVPCGMCRP